MRTLNKSAVLVSTFLALAAHQINSQAQAADSGTLVINGQISATTCVLNMGDAGSTGTGSKTLNLGTYTTTVANAATATGGTFGTPQTVLFSVKNADGTSCTFGAGNTKWDIGVNLPASQYTLVAGKTLVLSSGSASNIAANVGVQISTSTGAAVTTGATAVNFSTGIAPYGTLLSGSTSSPAANPTDLIALTAQMARTNASTVTAGAFSTTIPLNVWYK